MPDRITVTVTDRISAIDAALTLVHDGFVESGFMRPQRARRRVIPQYFNPGTFFAVAYIAGRPAGALVSVPDGPFGLPSEAVYPEEFSRIRATGVPIETGSLAIAPAARAHKRRLLTMHHHIYAAPEYLNEHGEPKHVDDLENHKLIVYGDAAHPPISGLNWLLELGADTGVKRRAVLKVNSAYAIFRAVQSGLGLGALPDYIGQDAGNLVQVMPDLEGPSVDVYFAYPEELRNSKRIGVFRDFLVQKINHDHP